MKKEEIWKEVISSLIGRGFKNNPICNNIWTNDSGVCVDMDKINSIDDLMMIMFYEGQKYIKKQVKNILEL